MAFRDELINLLPMDGGVQLFAMIQDVADRIAAGEFSYDLAFQRLVRAADRFRNHPALTDEVRQQLHAEAAKLARIRGLVATSVNFGGIVREADWVSVDTAALEQLLATLSVGQIARPPGES